MDMGQARVWSQAAASVDMGQGGGHKQWKCQDLVTLVPGPGDISVGNRDLQTLRVLWGHLWQVPHGLVIRNL